MTYDDPTERVPLVQPVQPMPPAQPTRRDRRIERDRRHPSAIARGWLWYSIAVVLITAAAAWLATSAGR
jgi:hypothetical protein